jgi:hypothetical protein
MTLVEVLMSMLVMGIGVLGVVALLPLAFVRAVQATNLTNGTILRFNAESQIYVDQFDLEYVFPYWQPNTTYAQGPATTGGPQPPPPSIVLGVGNVRYRCFQTGTSISPGPPQWNTTVGAQWSEMPGNANAVQWITEDHSHYVIDPLGWNTMGLVGNNLQGVLGNNQGTAGTIGVPPTGTGIERFNGGINASADGGNATTGDANSVALASARVTLPDSWVEQARGPATNLQPQPPPANTGYSSVDLAGVDLSGVQYFGAVAPNNGSPGAFPTITSRVVFTNATQPATAGKLALTRLITNIKVNAGPVSTITWGGTASNDPLPAGYTPTQVRVETQDRRYTWMLTVRRTSSGPPNVDVTVFFNRTLTADDEQTYSSAAVAQTQFTVTYGASPKPFAKKGGFLFDVTNGRWYRVINIADNGTALSVTVDRPRPLTDGTNFTAVFMRGVVNVYSFPLKS